MKLYITSLLLIIGSICLQAQPIRVSTLAQMMEVAQECETAGDYVNALEWYGKAFKETKDISLLPKLAELNNNIRSYERAKKWYALLFKREKQENQFLQYRLGYADVLKSLGEYQKALDNYKTVLSNNPSEEDRKRAMFEVDGINQYNSLSDNVEVAIKSAGAPINKASAESRPIEYTDGTVYFSSFNRPKAIDLADVEADYHMKIYTATNNGGKFTKPKALPQEINRKDFHTSNPTFSDDGREMYFTRYKMEDAKIVASRLYRAYSTDEGWKPPIEIEGLVAPEYSLKHPALGELYGDKVLFFVSDMPGGNGGDDIYYAKIQGETFATPINLGSEVNTAVDDITPFYHGGTLYYSTNGLPTIGGYDIFTTKWNGETWSKPENMGLGYNSSFDDMYLSFAKAGNRGYLVSNRPSKNKKKITSTTCCDDIFTVDIRDLVIDLLATVTDEAGPLDGAKVSLRNLTDPSFDEVKREEASNEFKFLLNANAEYRVVFEKPGYYPDSLEFNTAGIIDDYTVSKSVQLNKDPNYREDTGDDIALNGNGKNGGNGDDGNGNGSDKIITETYSINEPIRLNNIYYDLDDTKILKSSEKDLSFLLELMNRYPDMVIELSSHTDSRGRAKYNQSLSQRRSDSAAKWLRQRGIAPSRIVAKGYGETQILNGCVDGVDCPEDMHRQNRRTEFKIIAGPTTIEVKRKRGNLFHGGQAMIDIMDLDKYSVDTIKTDSIDMDSVAGHPDFTFDDDHFNLGEVTLGEKKSMLYRFENSGDADLIIELVTACKCTQLDWTRGAIAPGERGEIFVQFDSSTGQLGEITKVVDIIANTPQVVNEIRFDAVLVTPVETEDKEKEVKLNIE